MFKTEIIECIQKKVVKILTDMGFMFFIGGSVRFAYNTRDSDLDIFIKDRSGLRAFLKNMGFVKTIEYEVADTYSYYDFCHILVIKNLQYYHNLEKEHEEVEEFLTKRPQYRHMIKKFREKGMFKEKTGKEVYRTLVSMMKWEIQNNMISIS